MFNGRIFIEFNMLNFLVEEGLCTEDAECNLRGDIEILIILSNSLNIFKHTVKRKAIFKSFLDACKY